MQSGNENNQIISIESKVMNMSHSRVQVEAKVLMKCEVWQVGMEGQVCLHWMYGRTGRQVIEKEYRLQYKCSLLYFLLMLIDWN